VVSLSFWRDAAAIAEWRRGELFCDYRLRIALVIRDYGTSASAEVPADSKTRRG